MSQGSENVVRVHPTLHHFGLTTARPAEMLDWYAKVLGMAPNFPSSTALSANNAAPILWVTNDQAHHRIALISLPGLRDDPDKRMHSRLQHVAFEYATIDDLLNSYIHLKDLGIEPVLTVDHGLTIAFYYVDPDGNSVELLVDAFGDWARSSAYMRISPEFAANPMGTFIDPERMLAACNAGATLAELHQRAMAGEFPPSHPMDPRVLL